LVLKDSDQAHFAGGPHFSNQFWSDLAFPKLAKTLSEHYGLQTPGLAEAGGSKKASAQADSALTQAVIEELVRLKKKAMKLDIVVTTLDGRVTVSGNVANEQQKQQILAVAGKVAGPGQVEDKLVIQRANKSTKL
ncbi:MAG TPA: BON domain-containing protein, partial [Clostridia bacterium]|nr:BON domain-containing protein [Clostridia bacterium]